MGRALPAAAFLLVLAAAAAPVAGPEELASAVRRLADRGAGDSFLGCGLGGDGAAGPSDDWVCVGVEESQLAMADGYLDACEALGTRAYCEAAQHLLDAGSPERVGCERCGCDAQHPRCTYLATQEGLVSSSARACRMFGGRWCNVTRLYAAALAARCGQYGECSLQQNAGSALVALGDACAALGDEATCGELSSMLGSIGANATPPSELGAHAALMRGIARSCRLHVAGACERLRSLAAQDEPQEPSSLVALMEAYADACDVLDANDTAGENCLRLIELAGRVRSLCERSCDDGETVGRLMRVLFRTCKALDRGCEDATSLARAGITACGPAPDDPQLGAWNCGSANIRDAGFLMQGYAAGCLLEPERKGMACGVLARLADTGAGTESGRCGMGDGVVDDSDDWDCGDAWGQASSAIGLIKACEVLGQRSVPSSCEAARRLLRGYTMTYGCAACGCGMGDGGAELMDDWVCDTPFAQGMTMLMYGQACRTFGGAYCSALGFAADHAPQALGGGLDAGGPEAQAALAMGYADACTHLNARQRDGPYCRRLGELLKANATRGCGLGSRRWWCGSEVGQGLSMLAYARACELLELPATSGPFCSALRQLAETAVDEAVTNPIVRDEEASSEFVLTLAYARACELLESLSGPSPGPVCREFLARSARGSADRIDPRFGCGPAGEGRPSDDWDCDHPAAQGEAMMAYAKACELCGSKGPNAWALCKPPFCLHLASLASEAPCGLRDGVPDEGDTWDCGDGGSQGQTVLGYVAAFDVIAHGALTGPYPLMGPTLPPGPAAAPDCSDQNNCTSDSWDGSACVYQNLPCGASCDAGRVCNGQGLCSPPPQAGAACLCEAMCPGGLKCANGTCAATVCGNKRCEAEECATCGSDCALADCAGNGRCDPKVGENCALATADCPCPQGYVCKPSRKHALDSGCYEFKCGDNYCDSPEEGPATCCEDCRCPPDSYCDEVSHACSRSCGDGVCSREECSSCPKDCSPDKCADGTCQPEIGENCLNTPDCVCRTNIGAKDEVILVEGEAFRVSFLIENDGNIKETYEINVQSDMNVESKHRTIELSPKLNYEIDLSGQQAQAGTYRVVLVVRAKGAARTLTETTLVKVTGKNPLVKFIEEGPLRIILDLKDTLEVLLFLGMATLFLNRFLRRNQRPRYPQDSYYLYGYYPPQWYSQGGYGQMPPPPGGQGMG